MIKFLKQIFCIHRWTEWSEPYTIGMSKMRMSDNYLMIPSYVVSRTCEKCKKVRYKEV